jgi:Zn-finger protein
MLMIEIREFITQGVTFYTNHFDIDNCLLCWPHQLLNII